MGENFKPKGKVPQWRIVYDAAMLRDPGDLITFTELSGLLGYDPSVPGNTRGPIYAAARRMLVDHSRTLISDPKKGYRVAVASEHEGMARSKQRSARRRIQHGVALATHVDLSSLTPTQRRSLEAVALILSQQNAMLQRHDSEIKDVQHDVQRVDDRLAAIEAAIGRAGIPVPGTVEIEARVIPGS